MPHEAARLLRVQGGGLAGAGVVDPEVGHGEGRHPREPEPVPVVEAPVRVQQLLVEDVPPELPVLVQVAAGQEARHGVPPQVVHPPDLVQLAHQGVYEGVAGLPLLPRLEVRLVPGIPLDVLAHDVVRALVEVLDKVPEDVEHLPEVDLAQEGPWWARMLSTALVIHGLDLVEETADRYCAELEMRGQAGGCRHLPIRRHVGARRLRLLELADERPVPEAGVQEAEPVRLAPVEVGRAVRAGLSRRVADVGQRRDRERLPLEREGLQQGVARQQLRHRREPRWGGEGLWDIHAVTVLAVRVLRDEALDALRIRRGPPGLQALHLRRQPPQVDDRVPAEGGHLHAGAPAEALYRRVPPQRVRLRIELVEDMLQCQAAARVQEEPLKHVIWRPSQNQQARAVIGLQSLVQVIERLY
mmetsp:Transcript_117939/g.334433  ORF Transcript_117939/g.334433 Transcript_117939/m.334433 type:complete len:414 (-) Transcript_117939:242-1483(-)